MIRIVPRGRPFPRLGRRLPHGPRRGRPAAESAVTAQTRQQLRTHRAPVRIVRLSNAGRGGLVGRAGQARPGQQTSATRVSRAPAAQTSSRARADLSPQRLHRVGHHRHRFAGLQQAPHRVQYTDLPSRRVSSRRTNPHGAGPPRAASWAPRKHPPSVSPPRSAARPRLPVGSRDSAPPRAAPAG